MERDVLLKYALVVCTSLMIAFGIYFANPYFASAAPPALRPSELYLSQKDVLLLEGMLFVICGVTGVMLAGHSKETYTESRLGQRKHVFRWVFTTHAERAFPSWLFLVGLTLVLTGATLTVLAYI